MRVQTSFANTDRYVFDFKLCKAKDGYAQLDTTEDAHYFGNWVNFKKFEIVSYCEGDITVTNCDNKEEFIKELKRTVDFYKFNQETFKGIDLMCNENIINDFNNLKLDKKYYLHHCDIKEN